MTTPLVDESTDTAPQTDDEAPYGLKADGTPRAKPGRKPGTPNRPKEDGGDGQVPSPPSLEELREGAGAGPAEDTSPGSARRGRRRGLRIHKDTTPGQSRDTAPTNVPPFRAGPIAKGVNRLYRRAGKLLRTWDPFLGNACISITQKDDDDDVTVGEAWEEIARTNVQVRTILTKLITGGAWGQLFVCHAPIMVALLMKDSIRSKIPFGHLLGAMLEPDDTPTPEWGPGHFDPSQIDMGALLEQASQMAAEAMSSRGGMPRQPVPDWAGLDVDGGPQG